MPHLSTDRLAELGDDTLSSTLAPWETAHLAECAACAGERSAFTALVAMARAERDPVPLTLPLTRWDAIAAELASAPPAVASPPTIPAAVPVRAMDLARVRRLRRWPMRAAAGLLLVASGVLAGRVSAGARPIPAEGEAARSAAVPTSPAGATSLASLAADTPFASMDEARQAQQRSELLYQQATAWIAQHDSAGASGDSPVAYRSRLAALDRVISTTREAMREVPHDPVINGYYLTTLGQREATLRQLNTALPTSLRVNSF